MALVSSSVPIHLRQPQLHGFSRNPSMASPSVTSLVEIEEEEEEAVQVEKVYVAVGKEYKENKETLVWLLQRISRDKKVVLVHVHRPAQMIPMMGAKFPVSQLTAAQVKGYRTIERQKMDKDLDEYLALCRLAKVQAEKLVIEMDDIGKGLVELIAQEGITKLVIGAAADRQYSKKLKAPKSKTAISVQQQADPSCKIWFVCKGNLICTRGAGLERSGEEMSPITSLNSSQSQQGRSVSLPHSRNRTLAWLANHPRSRSVTYNSQEEQIMAVSPLETPILASRTVSISSAEGSVFTDPQDGISSSPQVSDQSTLEGGEDVFIGRGSLPIDVSENCPIMLPPVHEPEELVGSRRNCEQEDNVIDVEVYEMLQHALKEAEDARREAYEESCRRRKAEIDAIEASRKVKASENFFVRELKQRKDVEETLEKERLELEKLKSQNDKLMEELQKENGKKALIEVQIAQSEQTVKDLKEKLSSAKHLLRSLQKEHKELQKQRDDAIKEAEELRQIREEAAGSSQEMMYLSEFTYSEIEEATNNFNASMKIGEGGYGCVYKGFLRHTMVAIKVLNPQSMQGQKEFYQEVDILSKVRHPHLVTLIGTCPEAWAIVYEYLPEGSLEDRLMCKGNSPPLPWHIRTKILAEICSSLIFLHSYKPHTVVHGDLKPANILLDSNYTSKLGDFGICRLLVQSNTTTFYRHTHPQGTFVYMDPEFLSTGELTSGSDVYSFGVIILRLITGRPALGITKEVKEAVEGNRLHEILDVSAGDWPFLQAKQLANLALKCCDIKRKNRPELARDAWRVLEPMMKATSSMGSNSGNSCIPSYFICPIFQEIMRDPHIAADGFTYEAEALKGWLDSGHEESPMTNLKLPHHDLIPNRALRSAIQEWLQKQQ